MKTFATRILATVAVMALTCGSLTAGEKKGGKSSGHTGPSKSIHFDKWGQKNHGHFDFHFKWHTPHYHTPYFWYPKAYYPWWFFPPSYPFGVKPIDPGIGNGYPGSFKK